MQETAALQTWVAAYLAYVRQAVEGKINDLKLVDKLLSGSYTIFRSLTLFIEKAPTGEYVCGWKTGTCMIQPEWSDTSSVRSKKGEISMMNKKTKSFSNITLKYFLAGGWEKKRKKETSTQKTTTPHSSNHEKPIKNPIKKKETFWITQ